MKNRWKNIVWNNIKLKRGETRGLEICIMIDYRKAALLKLIIVIAFYDRAKE